MNISLTIAHRWGKSADEETNVRRQPALSVAWLSSSGMFRVDHSLTLSSQLFPCLPRFRPPSTVPALRKVAEDHKRQNLDDLKFYLYQEYSI